MKKFNFLLSLIVGLVLSAGAQVSISTGIQALPAGAGTSANFSMNSQQIPAGDGTLTLYYQGDFDGVGGNLENAEVFDENNVFIGASTSVNQCDADLDSVEFTISRAMLTGWVLDGVIDFTVTPNANVNPGLCADNNWGLKLEYVGISGTNNAAVGSIDSVGVFCEGNVDVYATVLNLGLNQIDSVMVNWEVNGVAQPTFNFIGLLDTVNGLSPFDTLLNIGSAFLDSGTNVIRVYTSMPNGVADTINLDDTLEVTVESGSLPENISVYNILTTSVEVFADGFPGSLDYQYDVANFSLGTGNTGTTTSAPFSITGLTAGTGYDLYLRNDCGNGDTSAWVGPIRFTTFFEVPFSQDFENFTDQQRDPLREGWTNESSNGFIDEPFWEAERANGFNQGIGGNSGPIYDHTSFGTGGGTHMIMNSWLASIADSATLVSPPIFISNSQNKVRLSYWYFMVGANTGTVNVIVDTNGVEEVIATYTGEQQANQQDDWFLAEHYLSGYAGKSVVIKFRSYGVFTQHRPAIDDVSVDTIADVTTSVVEVLEPSGALCPGGLSPVVAVRNTGIDDITSFQVVADVNGTLDTTSHTRTITTGDTVHVTLNSVNFTAGILYDLRFYTTNPNGVADEDNTDDTLAMATLTTGLDGDVTIDASQPISATNFQTFRALASRLNEVGVCGNVTVNVAPGDYIGDFFILNEVDGLDMNNQLVIDGDSATGSTDSVLLRNTGSTSNRAIGLNRTSYVTIKNMKVEGRYSGGGVEFGAHFMNNANHNTFDNIFFDMDAQNFNIVTIGASSDPNSQFAANGRSNANYNKFMNLEMEGSDDPVYFEGPLDPANGFNTGNEFLNCEIYNYNSVALFFDGSDSTVIDGDSIYDARSTFGSCINMFDAMNFRISNNHLHARDEGIVIFEANSTVNPQLDAEIYNNMVTVTNANGFANAIYLRNPLRINMWYNSIYSADENDQPAVHFDGFTIIDSLDVRNNIFSSFDVPVLQINGEDDTLAFLRFDNNVYWRDIPGTILSMNGNNYTNLSAYQGAVPVFNVNSIHDDPQFNSVDDLHIIGIVPSDAADNSVPVFTDIDGEVRPSINALFADIGADEYDPPTCPPPNGLKVEFIQADSVRVTWIPKSPGTRVQYEYGLNPFTIGNGTSAVSTTDTGLIGGLMENTEYSIAIRQVCGRGDTSRYTKQLIFRTPCFPKPAGYYIDFDAQTTNEPAECWSQFYENDGQNFAEVRTFPNVLGTRSLVMSTWFSFSAVDTVMGISPIMDSITTGNYRIQFQTASEDNANALIVGTTPVEGGAFGFTPLDTIIHQTPTVYEHHFVDITTANGYNGTDQHIAFMHSGNTDFDEINIDEFLYEEIPSCLEPRGPYLEFLGSDSIIVGWEDFAGTTEWEIEYGFDPLSIGTGTRILSTSNPDTITGLLPSSDYELVVRAICAPGDTSNWSFELTFTTECIADTADLFEDWDALPTFVTPDCWMEYLTGTQINGINAYVEVRGGGAFSGNNTLRLNTWINNPGDTVAAISNRFEDMTDGDKRIRFVANTTDFALNQDLTVFTVDKRGPGANWTEMENITFSAPNVYDGEYIVDLTAANGYNGTDQYIAFSAGIEIGDGVRIDDFYYEDIPSCPRPRDLVAIPGTDSAVVFWSNTSPSDTVMIAYSLAPFDSTTAVYDTIVGNRDTLRGLFGGTFYDYRVAIICGPGDTSRVSSALEFLTECVPYDAPYFKDFEAELDNTEPVCWTEYSTLANTPNHYARVQQFTGFNSDKSMEMNSWFGWNATTDTLGILTPEFRGMSNGDKRLRFMSLAQNTSDRMFVYTADRPDISANMSIIDTVEYDNPNEWKIVYIDLTTANGYNGTDSVIFFKHSYDNTFTDLRIDDFHYEDIPSCLAPRDNFVGGLTPDSASLGWDDYATGVTEWEIEWDSAFAPGDEGTGQTYIATSNPAPLTGLAANSDYGFRVRAICAPGDTSFWTGIVEFRTPCAAFSAPYFTDFDAMANNNGEDPECWSSYDTYDPNFDKVFVDAFSADVSPNNNMEINSWFNFTLGSDTLIAITPKFSDVTAGDKRLRFQAMNNNFQQLGELYVWTADGPDPSTATINVVDTLFINAGQNVYQEYIVNLDSANGYNRTDEYIYLAHSLAATFVEFHIDDFNYEEIPTCIRVDGVDHLHFNADSTELTWNDPNGATWFEIEYGLGGFTPGTGTKVYSQYPGDTLYNLQSSSFYEVYIRAICDTTAGNEDTSFVTAYSFESFCEPLPAPYYTSFESTPNDSMVTCWAAIYTQPFNPGLAGASIQDDNFPAAVDGDKALVLNTWNASAVNSDTLAAITPPMDSITNGNMRINFQFTNNDIFDGVMYVGTSADQNRGFTLNVLDSIVGSAANTWEEFTVDITAANGYNGTDEHIVFWHTLDQFATFTEVQVDDLTYEKIPTCWPPIDLNAQFIGEDSAFVAWNDTNGATQWEFEFGRAGFVFGTGSRVLSNSDSYLVDTLTGGTAYEYYVRAICTAGDTSTWTEIPGKFLTKCNDLVPATLPWIENWDSVSTSVIIGDANILCSSSYEWIFSTSDQVNGRIRTGDTSITSTSGNGKAVTMDAAVAGITPDAINELVLNINLDGYQDYVDLRLEFSIMHHGEERDSNDYISIRGFEGDPWIRIAYIPDVVGFGNWTRLGFDIDSLLWHNGNLQMVSNSFQVKFGQEDNWTATAINVSDGITIDSIEITGGLVTGVNEVVDRVNNIRIYPNPSTGLFTINIETEQTETYNVTVRDIKGQIVYEEIANVNGQFKKDLDFTGFAKGLYFMQVQSDRKSVV